MDCLRVLVVDDTIVYRKIVSDILKETEGVEVIGVAHNGKIALDKIRLLRPDFITLDIEMPVMNGIELLKALQNEPNPPGVAMLSTLTSEGSSMTLQALELGAFDFILKPQEKYPAQNREALSHSLQQIIATYRLRNRAFLPKRNIQLPRKRQVTAAAPNRNNARKGRAEIIAIGISTGGPNALNKVLPELPANIGVPIVIVQHMPPVFTASLAASLDKKCKINVKEGEEGEALKPGWAYIAPGGKQMKIVAAANGRERLIAITDDPPENSCRPSVDYLFRSVADYYVGRSTAVIMTGMGADGTRGLRTLQDKGAYVIGQNEASCVVYGMPKSAAEAGVVDTVCSLEHIAQEIVQSTKRL